MGLVVVGSFALGLATWRQPTADPCRSATRDVEETWSERTRAAVRASIDGPAETWIARADGVAAELRAYQRASCAATNRDDVASRTRKRSCVARRTLELAAISEVQLATRDTRFTLAQLGRMPPIARCEEIDIPAAPSEATRPLYVKFFRTLRDDLDDPAPFRALARVAATAGDAELASRAAVAQARAERNADQMAASDETAQRAYNEAIAARNFDVAVAALAERAWSLANMGEIAPAASMCKLADDLIAQHAIAVRPRMRAAFVRGHVEMLRNEFRAAIGFFRTVDELDEQHERRNRDVVLVARMSTVEALQALAEDHDATIAFARQVVALAQDEAGERSVNHAYATMMLAETLDSADRIHDALVTHRRALELYREILPANHSRILYQREELAGVMIADRAFTPAHEEVRRLLDEVEQNEGTKRFVPSLLVMLGDATFGLGDYEEAIHVYERALEQMISIYTRDSDNAQRTRRSLATYQIELGRLDVAARLCAAVLESYTRKPTPNDMRPAEVRGTLLADIALARGSAAEAERLARGALEELGERGARPHVTRYVERRLGEALLASRRPEDARRVLEQALSHHAGSERLDEIALVELGLARAEFVLGDRDAARARIARARDSLSTTKAQPRARAQIAKLLATW